VERPKTRYARSGDCHIAYQEFGNGDLDLVLVSRTVRDLVAGSGIEFADRGRHELKRGPGRMGHPRGARLRDRPPSPAGHGSR
jgi:hypothetical protein